MSAISSIKIPNGTSYEVKDQRALRAAMAAPEFSSSTQYYPGDTCTYNGEVYRATQNHYGAWNSAHFSKCDPLQTQVDAIFSGGVYVLNPNTGLWHKLIAQNNGSGYITLGVEQNGVPAWPRTPDDSSGSDSSSSGGLYCDTVTISYYEGSGYMMGYNTVVVSGIPGSSQTVSTAGGGSITAARGSDGRWRITGYSSEVTVIDIECGGDSGSSS